MPADSDLLTGDLIRAVELLSETFAAKSIRYALIGGLATLMRGRPRFTQDVDILLDAPQIVLPSLLEELTRVGFDLDLVTVNPGVRSGTCDIVPLRIGANRLDQTRSSSLRAYAHRRINFNLNRRAPAQSRHCRRADSHQDGGVPTSRQVGHRNTSGRKLGGDRFGGDPASMVGRSSR